MSDFVALQVMSQVVVEMRKRAGQGMWRIDGPMDNAYLNACRLVVPELGAALLMAFEDLEPHQPPAECRYALHFAMTPLSDEFMRKAVALRPATKVLDAPSRSQRLRMTQTVFGPDWPITWCRVEHHDGEAQLHCWLFAKPNTEKHMWEPHPVDSRWPRASGMRRLVEYFA